MIVGLARLKNDIYSKNDLKDVCAVSMKKTKQQSEILGMSAV
jgi:hypothetical protein